MRRGGHRTCAASVETCTRDEDLDHFQRLARSQGVEGAVTAFTKDELLTIMRRNDFTYINPRSRKVDLGYALMGA